MREIKAPKPRGEISFPFMRMRSWILSRCGDVKSPVRRPALRAEDLQEAEGLPPDPAKPPPFLEDERPAHHREAEQREQDHLRHGPGVGDELDDVSGQIVRHGFSSLSDGCP